MKKKITHKKANISFFVFVFLIILMFILALFLGYKNSRKIEYVKSNIKAIDNKIVNFKASNYEEVYIDYFSKKFIKDYIDFKKDDYDNDKRLKRLLSYYPSDVKYSLETSQQQLQNYKNSNLVAIKNKKNNIFNVIINVDYEIVKEVGTKTIKEEVDKETNKKKTIEHIVYKPTSYFRNLNYSFDLKLDKGNLYVINQPYIVDDVKRNKDFKLNINTNLKLIKDEQVLKDLEDFTKNYLTKYFKGDKDIGYLGNVVPLLVKGYNFATFENFSVYENEKGYLVKALFVVLDNETLTTHNENISLLVIKKNKKYFIEEVKR